MRRRRSGTALPRTAVGVLIALSVLAAGSAAAQPRRAGETEVDGSRSVDEATAEILVDAHDLLAAADYPGALAKLARLRTDRLSPYQRARAEHLLFAIAFEQGELDAARGHLAAMIASGGLNEQELSQARFEHARLYIAQERWAEGAAALEEWFATAVNANFYAHYLLAVAHYQTQNFDRALAPAERAVQLSPPQDSSAPQLLLAIHAARADYRAGIPLLERLAATNPADKRWWLQLSTFHSLVGEQAKALAVMDLAQLTGAVTTESELVRLADLLAVNGIPHRCATVITHGLERAYIASSEATYRKAADCWLAARELDASLAPLTRAAELAAGGDRFVQLAEVQVQRRDWDGVVSAAARGIAKGMLDDAAKAHLLEGIGLYHLDRTGEARASLEAALPSARHGPYAREWLRRIDNDEERGRLGAARGSGEDGESAGQREPAP